jgi:uncharacterized RDD family membrane protein YckC
MTTTHALLRSMALAAALTVLVAGDAQAQARPATPPAPTPPPPPTAYELPGPKVTPAVERRRMPNQRVSELRRSELDAEMTQVFQYSRPVLRGFVDYTLTQGETVREVVIFSGNVRIEGTVEDDVMVTAGTVTIAPTGVVEGSLVVFGGKATIEQGGSVRQSIAIFGGTLDAPADLQLRGEQVIFGTPEMAEWVQSVLPWITRGLLLGRVVVPGLGWVWTVMFASFLVGLLLNHLFYRQVASCADVIVQRPLSTFLVGLAALLVVPLLLTIVAATVVGLIVIPFAIAACIVAAMIGKAGVARAIGRGVISEREPESRAQGARSFSIGVVIMMVAYMVPVVGILAWATAGVFGLGAAAMTMTVRLRRERPAAPPITPVSPPPVPPFSSGPGVPDYGGQRPSESFASATPAVPAMAFQAAEVPPVPPDAQRSFTEEAPVQPPPATAPISPPSGAAQPVLPGGLALYPRATFFDRLVAIVLDIVLLGIAFNFFDRWWWRDDEVFFALVLGYHVAFWAWKGTTLGGIICGLRVVRTNGENPRFVDALVRGLSAIFSVVALGLGLFWMINDAQRQMWHDKIAGTVVVKLPRELVLA